MNAQDELADDIEEFLQHHEGKVFDLGTLTFELHVPARQDEVAEALEELAKQGRISVVQKPVTVYGEDEGGPPDLLTDDRKSLLDMVEKRAPDHIEEAREMDDEELEEFVREDVLEDLKPIGRRDHYGIED